MSEHQLNPGRLYGVALESMQEHHLIKSCPQVKNAMYSSATIVRSLSMVIVL